MVKLIQDLRKIISQFGQGAIHYAFFFFNKIVTSMVIILCSLNLFMCIRETYFSELKYDDAAKAFNLSMTRS